MRTAVVAAAPAANASTIAVASPTREPMLFTILASQNVFGA
jgi:hypothetical protein